MLMTSESKIPGVISRSTTQADTAPSRNSSPENERDGHDDHATLPSKGRGPCATEEMHHMDTSNREVRKCQNPRCVVGSGNNYLSLEFMYNLTFWRVGPSHPSHGKWS